MKIKIFYPEVYEIARFGDKRKEFPPFGSMYIASVLEQYENEVHLDKICTYDDSFDLTSYDIVMFSLSSSCTYKMILNVKNKSIFNKEVKIIIGGIHATLYPHKTMVDFNSDYVIKGEGEIAVIEIIKYLIGKRNNDTIKGVLTKRNYDLNNLYFADSVEYLDKIPFPARHLLSKEDFIMTGRLSKMNLKMTHILTSRGCPYNCYFCGSVNKNHRYRNGEYVYNELLHLKNDYGIEGFVINDENFIINKEKVKNICNSIGVLQMPWSALSRVDTIDDSLLDIIKEAGCIELKFGLESGSDSMLKQMNKRCTIDQAQKSLDLCNKKGVRAKLFLIHGFPGENEQTTKETISFLSKNRDKINRVSLFRWSPLPGSFIYRHFDRYGLNVQKLEFENAIIYSKDNNWFIDENINNMLNYQYDILQEFIDSVFE